MNFKTPLDCKNPAAKFYKRNNNSSKFKNQSLFKFPF